MDEPVSFQNRSLAIRGMIGSPDGPDSGAGVVLLHGWGSCRLGPHRILVETARELNRRGFWTLRFDHLGRGESEGNADDATLDGMISDACAAAEYLSSKGNVKRLAFLGLCSGGNVAIGSASLIQGRGDKRAAFDIPALVLWSTLPFQTQRKRAADVKRTGFFLTQYVRKALMPQTWKKLVEGKVNFGAIGKVLFGHYRREEEKDGKKSNPKDSSRDIMDEFSSFKGAVLYVYGGGDPEAAGARQAYEPFCRERGIRAEFHTIEGANHNYYSLEWKEEIIGRSATFLEINMK